MLGPKVHVVAVLAALASGALAGLDFADNIHREFGMGIFPRAAADLQSFNGALGGVKASPVCWFPRTDVSYGWSRRGDEARLDAHARLPGLL